MKTFLLAALILAIGVAGMAVSILVKKDGQFPDGEISHNKELRLWGKKKNHKDKIPHDCPEGGCEGCAFNQINQSGQPS